MKYFLTSCLLLACLCLTGCGPQSPDALIKEQISIINETADTVESANSLDDAKASMEKLKERGEAVTAKLEALDLSDSEKAELMQRHQADMMSAVMRLQKAMISKTFDQAKSGMDFMQTMPLP